MEFGVVFTPRVGDYDLVALAESLGYDQAWFFDSQMLYSDVYATMAVAARETRRIRLATGVAVPTTRIAPVIAHSIATVAQLAPGRVELGVGNGNTARLTMGLKPVPLARMKRELAIIRQLLAGDVAIQEAEGEAHGIQLLHRDHGFINLEHPIPITLSAFGPKTLAYCGAECDAHLTWGASAAIIADARAQIAAAAIAAGRKPEDVPTKGIFPLSVLRPGETAASPRVLSALAPFITNLLHVQVEWGEDLLQATPEIAAVMARFREYFATIPPADRHRVLHEGHLVFPREQEREFVRPELAESVAIVAEPDAMIEHIRTLEAAGLRHFAFQVTDDPIDQMRSFAETVMRRYH